jgi:hypothetical protein
MLKPDSTVGTQLKNQEASLQFMLYRNWILNFLKTKKLASPSGFNPKRTTSMTLSQYIVKRAYQEE